mgnify:CR=1 FL=1
MATTFFDITSFPKNTIAGVQFQFRVSAKDSTGAVDTTFTGTVVFTSSDPLATLPAAYTFVGGDSGTRLFKAKMGTIQASTVTVTSGAANGTARTTAWRRPLGWGLDDNALLPYGDAASGIGSSLAYARAFSTREVDITVTNFVQDNSSFLAGDALNPSTWSVQRLDTTVFLTVVQVTQQTPFTYRLLTLEEFGPTSVTHRINTSTLKDVVGNLLNTPRNADFRGVTDASKSSNTAKLAQRKVASRDLANNQLPTSDSFAGTLTLTGGGDYQLVSGVDLVKKLIIRRLITRPGDFFHLPDYGVGLRMKEPVPASDLPKLKKAIETQVLREPEVDSCTVGLTQDLSNNVLRVRVAAVLKKTGESIAVGLAIDDTGISF